MTRPEHPFVLPFARVVLVALAIATIAAGATAYSQQSVSGAVSGAADAAVSPQAPAPHMVEVCAGACTVIFVSSPSAKFRLVQSQWSRTAAPKLPFVVNCAQSCGEFGEIEPGLVKTLYAEQEAATYTVVWVDANNNATLLSIPALTERACEPAFLVSSLPGISVMRSCSEPREAAGLTTAAAALPGGVIAGRITLPDGTPATRVRVSAAAEDPITGVWMATGVPNAPWIFQLTVNDGRLTGTVGQTFSNRTESVSIVEGLMDGNSISFSVLHSDRTNTRRITFTGMVSGDELTLSRKVQILSGRMDGGRGIYGGGGVPAFAARRATKAGAFTETDRDGRYRLDRLPPGQYRITAGLPEAPTFFPGVASGTDAALVTVGPHDTVDSRDFRLTGSLERGAR